MKVARKIAVVVRASFMLSWGHFEPYRTNSVSIIPNKRSKFIIAKIPRFVSPVKANVIRLTINKTENNIAKLKVNVIIILSLHYES